ncbi:MAG: enoyl-CoA hydratase/isomerase family protein [Ardenticatenaceae bacterium]|nr:enoyl-CoA hydratase/isomerase family protein [Ardenticatenaceae bacterium]MCB9445762.1 enoyl-CoA hydratase/isomerase family protein [Ardenticatenaceae bacterium]
MSSEIIYKFENNIATIRVNRPEARNALNWAAQEAFAAAVTAVSQTPAIRALIITGTGQQAFVAGGDLKELSQNPDRAAGERLNRIMSQALAQMAKLPMPVIAAINGDAFGGGCEIITACDLRMAAAHAQFSFAQVKVGLTTGWGGTKRLVHLIGQSRAMDLLLTARTFDAKEAYRLGFVHRLVPPNDDVHAAARSWATQLTQLPYDALAATKALILNSYNHSLHEENSEREAFLKLWAQPDHLEALAAFNEKRSPIFLTTNNQQPTTNN